MRVSRNIFISRQNMWAVNASRSGIRSVLMSYTSGNSVQWWSRSGERSRITSNRLALEEIYDVLSDRSSQWTLVSRS